MSVFLAPIDLLYGVDLYSCFQVAVTTATLYDHVLSLDREVELIWMKPLSLVTALYVIERYLGDVVLIVCVCLCFSPSVIAEVSIRLSEFRAWGALIYLWATQATMQLRIYAMYRRSAAILMLLLVLFVCEIVAIAVIIFLDIGPGSDIHASFEPFFGNNFCLISGTGKFVYMFIPIICFESLLFLLAVRMFVKNMIRNRAARKQKGGFRLNSFMRTLTRDSFFYFLVHLIAAAVVTALWLSVNFLYASISIPFVLFLEVLVGTRLILDFRGRYSRPESGPINSGRQSSLQFRDESRTTDNNDDSHVDNNDDGDTEYVRMDLESHRVSVRCDTETVVVSDIVETPVGVLEPVVP